MAQCQKLHKNVNEINCIIVYIIYYSLQFLLHFIVKNEQQQAWAKIEEKRIASQQHLPLYGYSISGWLEYWKWDITHSIYWISNVNCTVLTCEQLCVRRGGVCEPKNTHDGVHIIKNNVKRWNPMEENVFGFFFLVENYVLKKYQWLVHRSSIQFFSFFIKK